MMKPPTAAGIFHSGTFTPFTLPRPVTPGDEKSLILGSHPFHHLRVSFLLQPGIAENRIASPRPVDYTTLVLWAIGARFSPGGVSEKMVFPAKAADR
jgi:hypothetical protein